MKYIETDGKYSIHSEIENAVQETVNKMSLFELQSIRDCDDNTIEVSYNIKGKLGIDIDPDKIWDHAYLNYVIDPTGRYIVTNEKHPIIKIDNGFVSIKLSVFDRESDVIEVEDDYYGEYYCVRMWRYGSFDDAMRAALADARSWLSKEEKGA